MFAAALGERSAANEALCSCRLRFGCLALPPVPLPYGFAVRIEESKHSIAELLDLYRRKDLVVNEEYQRAPRLWPPAARSYFIDTILAGFPFPKIYIWEKLNKTTMRPIREIVDGQQRMTSIVDFANDKFQLGKNAGQFNGKRYSELSDEEKESFLTYTVSIDVIRNAQRPEILQMFRRMNAYTLPLNDAEKRHSEFFGTFKDWINQLLDQWGGVLADWKILTSRQIVRMEDAEFFAEIAFAMQNGVKSSSNASLRALYEQYDNEFQEATEWRAKIDEVFGVITANLSGIQGTYMTKSYAFLSLVVALLHNRWGIPQLAEQTGIEPSGRFFESAEQAIDGLGALAAAHETKDKDTVRYRRYVEACIAGSNRANQRVTRAEYICKALQGTL